MLCFFLWLKGSHGGEEVGEVANKPHNAVTMLPTPGTKALAPLRRRVKSFDMGIVKVIQCLKGVNALREKDKI